MQAAGTTLAEGDRLAGRLEAIRHDIARIEGRAAAFDDVRRAGARAWPSGLAGLDHATGGGLAFGALHEIAPDRPAHAAHAAAFALALMARNPRTGPVVWCMTAQARREHGGPYGPGLSAFGLSPARFVAVTVAKPRDLAVALEEAAKVAGLAAVLAEGPLPSFTASRRIALALAASGTACLFIPDGDAAAASAATTRLTVAPLAGPGVPGDPRAPSAPAWRIRIGKLRGAAPGQTMEVLFDAPTLALRPLPGFSDRAVPHRGAAAEGVRRAG